MAQKSDLFTNIRVVGSNPDSYGNVILDEKKINLNLFKKSAITFAPITGCQRRHPVVPRGIAHDPTKSRIRESRDLEFALSFFFGKFVWLLG